MPAEDQPGNVSVPAGWMPTTIGLATVDGATRMHVSAHALRPDEGTATLAEHVSGQLREQFPGIVLEKPRSAGDALSRRFKIASADGAAVDRLQLYHAAGPLGYVATVSSEGALPGVEDEARLAGLLASLDFTARSAWAPTADFSVDELIVLAELGGRRSFPGLLGVELDPRARLAARRALVARGTLNGDKGAPPTVDPAQAALVATVLDPRAVVAVQRAAKGVREKRLYSIGTGLAVSQHAIAPGVIRLAAALPLALPLMIGDFLEVDNRARPAGAAIEGSVAALRTLIGAAERGELGTAEGGLRETLRHLRARAVVRVRSGDPPAAAGELHWLDCGARGLWRIENAGERAMLTPVSAVEVAERLMALLRVTVDERAT